MFFKKKKQEEKEKDEYHIKFGFFSNTVYILSMMHKYKKGLVFTMILFSICVAANNYIFSFIGKIGIDLVGGKTAIYISHRLSSCRFCDKIAVFSDGTIREYGHHDDLVKYKNGIYAEMFQAQAQYYQ